MLVHVLCFSRKTKCSNDSLQQEIIQYRFKRSVFYLVYSIAQFITRVNYIVLVYHLWTSKYNCLVTSEISTNFTNVVMSNVTLSINFPTIIQTMKLYFETISLMAMVRRKSSICRSCYFHHPQLFKTSLI
jgi:hypothetical protein